jgi:hypothetical protein
MFDSELRLSLLSSTNFGAKLGNDVGMTEGKHVGVEVTGCWLGFEDIGCRLGADEEGMADGYPEGCRDGA